MSAQADHGERARVWARQLGRTGHFAPEQLLLVWILTLTVNDRWESPDALEGLATDAGMSIEEVKHNLKILRESRVVSWYTQWQGEYIRTPFTLNPTFPEPRRT